jgi:hypothetical protein
MLLWRVNAGLLINNILRRVRQVSIIPQTKYLLSCLKLLIAFLC